MAGKINPPQIKQLLQLYQQGTNNENQLSKNFYELR